MTLSTLFQSWRLERFISQLKTLGFETGNLELTEEAGFYFANLYRQTPRSVISESIFCGSSSSQSIAISKAIVESIERGAFIEGHAAGLASCQTEKSEGFAGYPTTWISRRSALKICRTNALAEAIERFAWATWWDDVTISYRYLDFQANDPEEQRAMALLNATPTHSPLRSVKVIEPATSASTFRLRILLAEFADGGFITGGAAGPATTRGLASSTERAASELAKHMLALERMAKGHLDPTTPYEAKLAYFGFGEGAPLVRARLAAHGTKVVKLPELVVDEEIPHRFSKVVVVYRCLFKDQPPFVSGPIGRLCI